MVPDIQQDDIDAVVNVLRSGMLVQGLQVKDLEKTIEEYLGVKHAIAVSNGTASLHLALVALGIGRGDEVILPAFSFMATGNVVEIVGATPVFVDIDIQTYNIDVSKIEKAITSKTKAILPVHEFGLACDIEEICRIAKKHDISVIEDAACAFGATENDRYAGTLGNVGSFSFHPRKAITSGEGGMIITNNDLLARKFRILRNHGIENLPGKIQFVDAGFNYRMTDFQAALLNSQFTRLKSIFTNKDQLVETYFNILGGNKYFRLPYVPENKKHTWQSFHILLDDVIDRDSLIELLKEKGIGTNFGAQCIPFQQYFQNKYNIDCEKYFPNALRAFNKGLVLPLYSSLRKDDILYIAETLNKIIN